MCFHAHFDCAGSRYGRKNADLVSTGSTQDSTIGSAQREELTGDIMTDKSYRLYGYRWVVLAVFMFINLTIQMLWITYAPITGPAARFYGVTDLQIGLLAMSFMAAFIPLSLPVSWAIDTFGFRRAVSVGAILMGIFGVAR
ncbi:MAG TPA: hypothetical protein VI958_09780, partial [Acidobacteriota bacterium]